MLIFCMPPAQETPTIRALRARFAQHNRQVLLLAGLTLFAAAALWVIAYAVVSWLALLFVSAVRGIEARPPETLPALFIYAAATLVLVSWWARRFSIDDTPRDEKSGLEIATEFLLAIPRMTLAIWGNLSAWQRLSDPEIEQAAAVIERLSAEGRVAWHSLGLDIPSRAARQKILLALQLAQLIHVRRIEGNLWIYLSRSAAELMPPTD